jgi:hypothetical protein
VRGEVPVKGSSVVLEAIEAYRSRQFQRDTPMLEILRRIKTVR